jgi:hypothetical protein
MWEWAAGLFEGEGYIALAKQSSYPRMDLTNTDLDVIQKFSTETGSKINGPYNSTRRGRTDFKPIWHTQLGGILGLTMLLNFWPHLGQRRRNRINEVLTAWEHAPVRPIGRPRGKER